MGQLATLNVVLLLILGAGECNPVCVSPEKDGYLMCSLCVELVILLS